MVRIIINEFTTWISVKIFEGGDFPRVRTAGSLNHFRTIMREEQGHFRGLGKEVRIERENAGRFGHLRLCEFAPAPVSITSMVETCDECGTIENVSTIQCGDFGHESLCEDCREELLEKI